MEESHLVGAENSPAKLMTDSSEKRKRGRPPRGAMAKAPVPKRKRVEKEEEEEEGEDVCFICFDGGSLVLCDHKGCPKAYHPACIKRDEAFFRAAAKWTCGWHICSVCQKGSRYMCYTCTYSVCKGCTKNADYFCVRGNKGFCSTCMRIIMLIENIDQGNKEMVQVDFDDKSSWEHLFKVYWMYLKEKLSLTVSELIQAKNPWKESDAVRAKRQRLPFCHRVVLDGKGIVGKSFEHVELKKPKQLLEPPYKDLPSPENRTTTESENSSVSGCAAQLELMQPVELELRCKDSLKTEGSIAIKTSLNGSVEWASKELLELVAHMKNGDSSVLSHLDVQALLLEYIKRNNLRDPRRKSQIICDSRLKSIFGKPRVGHIEMLKLLEFHFLIKEDSQKSEFVPAGIVGTVTSHAESDDNNDISLLKNKAKKRKSRVNSEEKLMQINQDEYAAIDAHNINLIYLRRDLMESLIEDMAKFNGRVIGSLVRIRISSGDQKLEMYRLVRVVGISKASVPYKIRDKTADVLLEVVNLNKKEAVAIDSISNQDFSEDECRRLRQIIRCGIVKRLTVGEIQKKAMELRAVKLNDSLEAEILRLSHLRDRASEKGRKKELRECVEKLELLKTPEERQRRLLEIPRVHADPKMDPGYESEEDAIESDGKKQVEHAGPRYTKFSRREDKLMSPCRKAKEGSVMARCKISEKRGAHGNNILMKLGNQSTACQAADRSASETSTTSLSTVNSTSANNSETEKLWHYRDPSARIQGPFSVMQLRKWNKSGLFPRDMRIWTNDEHHDAVLLINALNGLFHKAPRVRGEISHQSQEFGVASVNSRVGLWESATGTGRECGEREVRHLHITNNHSNGKTGITRMDRLSSPFPHCLDLNNSYSNKPKTANPVPSSSNGDLHVTPPHGKRCHEIVDFHSSTGHVVQDSSGSTVSQMSDGYNHSMQSNNQSHLGRSSGQKWESLTSNRSSVSMNSESSIDSATKSSDSFEQKVIKDFPDLPSPTPKTSFDDCEALAAEELLSLSSGVQVSASDIQDLPSPTPKLKGEATDGQAAADKETSCSSPVQDSGHSWSSASSLVTGGAELPEMAKEWGGHPPGGKPSVDSGEAPDGQAAANKVSSSSFPVQDSGHIWSSASSQVMGEAQLPEIAKEWSGHPPGDKPSVDSGEAADGQAAADKETSCSSPVQDSGHSWSSASSLVTGGAELPEIAKEWSGYPPGDKPSVDSGEALDGQAPANKESSSSFPVQDSGHSWSSASSQVIGGAQLPEIAEEWGGRSPGEKPSVDSGEAPDGQAAVNKESSSSFPVQDSGHSWSSASSQVAGGAQLPEIAKEWGGRSPGEKSSVESGVVSVSSLKPAEAVGDHVDTPTSDANQLNQTSPSNPVSNFFYWEPIEFTTLDEESVSDLLAEVDAMESQTRSYMGSPTSTIRCSDEMVSASISDCFSSIEELSPMPDLAKNDALSLTDDIQLPCLSSLTNELAGASQADAFDPLKRSSGNLSSSNEGETKFAEVSFAQGGAGSNVPPPCIMGRETAVSVISRSTGVEAITAGYRAAPGNMNSAGPLYGFPSVGHDSSVVTAWGNSHMNHAPFTGNPVFQSQCMYPGERSGGDGPREWVVPIGHSGFDRDRSYRQPFIGGEYSMPSKEQRFCKFYESGRCRNGASCDYLHL